MIPACSTCAAVLMRTVKRPGIDDTDRAFDRREPVVPELDRPSREREAGDGHQLAPGLRLRQAADVEVVSSRSPVDPDEAVLPHQADEPRESDLGRASHH